MPLGKHPPTSTGSALRVQGDFVDGQSSIVEWLSVRRASEMFGVSEATLWRWIKYRPDFPRPVKFSKGCTRLSVAQLDQYVLRLRREQ